MENIINNQVLLRLRVIYVLTQQPDDFPSGRRSDVSTNDKLIIITKIAIAKVTVQQYPTEVITVIFVEGKGDPKSDVKCERKKDEIVVST